MTDEQFASFLHDITACFLDKDFDLWMTRLCFPVTFVTSDGPTILTTAADARSYFDLCLTAIHTLHVDVILRRPISIGLWDPDTALVTFETELLSRGARLINPYTTHALLLHNDQTGWRMSSGMNALRYHQWTSAYPKPTANPT